MPTRQLDRTEIKREAKELIRTAHVSPIKFTLLYLLIGLVLDLLDATASNFVSGVGVIFFSVSFVSILISLIKQVLDAGYYCYCLGVHRREEMPCESLFDGFTFAGKVIALTIVEGVFIALWSLLFVIPGIIAAYRYSFAMWNLCADPSIGVMEALNRSKQQTRGYKWQYFVLQLSFFGWYLLVAVVASVITHFVSYMIYPDSLLDLLFSTLLLAVGEGVVELRFYPYYSLSVCGLYLRATAPFDAGDTQDRRGYDPEF